MCMLADRIEKFILSQLQDQNDNSVVFRRNELATRLDCAPSQITYVLNTRFSMQRGFVVESRRGTGGYIRIAWGNTYDPNRALPPAAPEPSDSITAAERYFLYLAGHGIITEREFSMIHEMIHLISENSPESSHSGLMQDLADRIHQCIERGE